MNWGYKILLVLILFVIGMGVMLGIALNTKNEMIDSDYYAKEMVYQSKIDASNNTNALEEDVTVTCNEQQVQLTIPTTAIQDFDNGTIEFLRPSDQSLDTTFTLALNDSGTQTFDNINFKKGKYLVRLQWQSQGIPYYFEQNLMIP